MTLPPSRIVRAAFSFGYIRARWGRALAICLVASLAGCRGSQKPAPVKASTPAAGRVDADYGKLPLNFEPNRGQADARVDFLARGAGYSLFLEPTEAVLSLHKPVRARDVASVAAKSARAAQRPATAMQPNVDAETSTLRMTLLGAKSGAVAVGQVPLPGKVNYYSGSDPKQWQQDVPTVARVRYSQVYRGVDLVYYGNQGQLEYDFVVAPGADPADIRLAFDGAVPKLDVQGDIVLRQGDAEVRLRKPIVYQDAAGVREPVAGRFAIRGNHEVAFAVAEYDRSRSLVVDPVLVYSTYLGGAVYDALYGLAVDSVGSAVVVGQTRSVDFPVTSGAYQSTNTVAGNGSAFVTKFSPDGTSLVFSTFLGSGGESLAAAVAVGPNDNIYVAGLSNGDHFPATSGALQVGKPGGQDAFVTAFTSDGKLVYSTFLGGTNEDYAVGIAVDAAGNAYVTGNTTSYDTLADNYNAPTFVLFPTTKNAYLSPFPASAKDAIGNKLVSNDALMPFLAELNPTGTALVYSTLLGASTCAPQCQDGTSCTAQGTCATGNCAPYCLNDSIGQGVAIGGGGIAYIAGWTSQPNFPTTPGSLHAIAPPRMNSIGVGGGGIGFVAAIDPTKSGAASLKYSTFLGGPTAGSADAVYGIAADVDGNAYVTGQAGRQDFPTTSVSYQPACPLGPTGCGGGAYVAKLDPTGSTLVYSTFLRTTTGGNTIGYNVRVDSARNAYVVGQVGEDAFPLVNPIESTRDGISLFISTLSADGSQLLFSTYFNGTSGNGNNVPFGYHVGLALDQSANIYVACSISSTNLVTTPGAFQPTLMSGNYDGFVAKISAVGAGPATSIDGGTDGAGGAADAPADVSLPGADAGHTNVADSGAAGSGTGGAVGPGTGGTAGSHTGGTTGSSSGGAAGSSSGGAAGSGAGGAAGSGSGGTGGIQGGRDAAADSGSQGTKPPSHSGCAFVAGSREMPATASFRSWLLVLTALAFLRRRARRERPRRPGDRSGHS